MDFYCRISAAEMWCMQQYPCESAALFFHLLYLPDLPPCVFSPFPENENQGLPFWHNERNPATTADFTNTTGHNRTEIPSWTEDLLHLNQVRRLFLQSKKMLISGITKYFLSTSHFSSTVLQVNTQQAPLIARGGWGGGGLGSCFCISCCSFRCAFLSCIQQQAH